MSSNKVLLTGATGFLGSEVAARLLKTRPFESIVLLGRRRPKVAGSLLALRLAEHGLDPRLIEKVSFVEADFGDESAFRAALRGLGPELDGAAVVHMAAVIHRQGSVQEQTRVNVGATDDLVDWCNERGGKFVFISSVVCFGGSDTPVVRSEKDFPEVTGPGHRFDYFRTKHEAHMRVLKRSRKPAVFLCPGIVHGSLEGFKDSRGHLKALREGRLSLAPSGGGNFVGLDRVAQATVDAALRESPARVETRLLVDRNMSYLDYFQLYVNLARGAQAQKIRAVPRFASLAARALQGALDASGGRIGFVEGLAQGSYWLHFESEHALPPTMGLEAALKASLDLPGGME